MNEIVGGYILCILKKIFVTMTFYDLVYYHCSASPKAHARSVETPRGEIYVALPILHGWMPADAANELCWLA